MKYNSHTSAWKYKFSSQIYIAHVVPDYKFPMNIKQYRPASSILYTWKNEICRINLINAIDLSISNKE